MYRDNAWQKNKEDPAAERPVHPGAIRGRATIPEHTKTGSSKTGTGFDAAGAKLAGVAGIEPTNAGVKVPCLTAWLHPTAGAS